MEFAHTERSLALQDEMRRFLDEEIYPAEETFEKQAADNRAAGTPFRTPAVLGELKLSARKRGLWNLFLPDSEHGAGLTVLDYAPIAELSGRSAAIAPEAMNCAAPDTGNMELLSMFATDEQTQQWLHPLLDGADPVLLLDDRARRRVVRRHQHRHHHHPRRRRLRRRRSQVVVDRRDAPGVQGRDRHGRQRPRRRAARPALDDPRAARRPRRARSSARRRSSATTTGRTAGTASSTTKRPRAGDEPARPAGRRLHDGPGPPGPRPHPPLHAQPRHGRAGAGADVRARVAAHRRSASRSPRTASCRSGSPSPGWRSTRRGCWCSRRRGSSTPSVRDEARTEIAAIKVAAPRAASYVLDRAIQAHGGAGVDQRRAARRDVGAAAHPAPGRRPGRGAPALDRPRGAAPARPGLTVPDQRTVASATAVCRRPQRARRRRRPVRRAGLRRDERRAGGRRGRRREGRFLPPLREQGGPALRGLRRPDRPPARSDGRDPRPRADPRPTRCAR